MKRKIDPTTTVIPFMLILILCILFMIFPDRSAEILDRIRFFLGDRLGLYYIIIGIGIFLFSIYIAFSKYGKIRLGKSDDKPDFGFWSWGAMLFTAGLAADILFYSFCEWILYSDEKSISGFDNIEEWVSTLPLFHWGPIPWSFYAVLAVCFGYMLHVRNCSRQKYSEACRPILGSHTDGIAGRFIDILAVFALIAGTATTFSIATPLLSQAISQVLKIHASNITTVMILIIICAVYTCSALKGMKGVRFLSNICMYVFLALLLYVLFAGGKTRYILETGVEALGHLVQYFPVLCTRTDPGRATSFPQNWTIFYWSYWLVWCVASPFFMGRISRGRTIKQTILGTYIFGMGATFVSFIILGGYGLALQTTGKADLIGMYHSSKSLTRVILVIINQLPFHNLAIILLIISMIAFYATSFDSITLVASVYSYRNSDSDDRSEASRSMKLFWAVFLIMLPIVLIYNENSLNNLQTVSIIAAFPIAIVILLIIAAFISDIRSAK